MAILDPTTAIGQMRLITADWQDLQFLPDSVYQSTLDDNDQNVKKSAQIVAQYILGMLAFKTHRKLQQLEVWGAEAFANYRAYLTDVINNPATVNGVISLASSANCCENPLITFQRDFRANYMLGTQSEEMARTAVYRDACDQPKVCDE